LFGVPKIFLLHKVVRDAKKVEKHCPGEPKLHCQNFDRQVRLPDSVFKIWLGAYPADS